MRIIEHGDQWEIAEISCNECKCRFAYNARDTKIETERDEDGDYEQVKVVICPECRERIHI